MILARQPRHGFGLLPLIVCSLSLASVIAPGYSESNTARKLIFAQYPGLKFGLTTQNFLMALPVSVTNAKKLIDYAHEQGYAWVELRDPDTSLSLEDCREIAAYAKERRLEAGYSCQRSLLDKDVWPIFDRALRNTTAFDGPRTVRLSAGGKEFLNVPDGKGWNAVEFQEIVARARRAAKMAKKNGLRLVIENATEPFQGDGATRFGLVDFLQHVGPDVGCQFDTGNFFAVALGGSDVQRVKILFEQNAHRLRYIHLKSAQNGKFTQTLIDNPLEVDWVVAFLAKHDIHYIALELPQAKTLDEVYHNHERSLEYLKEKGLLSVAGGSK